MSSKHKSEDYKITAVKYFIKTNKTQEEVCKIFGCSSRSLMRWIERYKKEGSIKRHSRKSISYKITKEQVKYILDELRKNKTITLEDLHIKTKEKFKDFNISIMHLSRIIKDNHISLKLTHIRHEPILRFGKEIDINKNIKEFYKEVKKYKIEDIICIDESSINALQNRYHCYNDVGKRCVIKTQSQEVFKKYTGIFAISLNGVEGWELYEKAGINVDRLYNFLEQNITSKYKNKLIILDNASSHRHEKIKELVNKHNNLLYSVPYQHFSNGIELYFSLLKSKLRKLEGLKYNELKENIKKVIKDISKENYKNILKGAYERQDYYIKKTSKTKKYKNYKN